MITRTGNIPGRYTVCTSGTRPSTPAVGDSIFETDTGKFLQWQSATTGWTPPWNSDFGNLGSGSATSSQTAISTVVDVTGLTVTFTAIANRRYKVTGNLLIAETVANDTWILTLCDGANTVKQSWIVLNPVVNAQQSITPIFVVTGLAAGSQTLKFRLARNAGTGTVTSAATAAAVASISVDDDGSNGAPL